MKGVDEGRDEGREGGGERASALPASFGTASQGCGVPPEGSGVFPPRCGVRSVGASPTGVLAILREVGRRNQGYRTQRRRSSAEVGGGGK